MMNHELEGSVRDELLWDPMIDSDAIAVSTADDGTVTLRGTVGSYLDKSIAASDAKRVFGVTAASTTSNDSSGVRSRTSATRI